MLKGAKQRGRIHTQRIFAWLIYTMLIGLLITGCRATRQTATATPTSATAIPNIEQRIGHYTLRIWKADNYPTHLPEWGYRGTATLTHDSGHEIIIEDAITIQQLPVVDINGDGYPDIALQISRSGSRCCHGTIVYTLDDGPTKLLSIRSREYLGGDGDFEDLNQDGVYEFITPDPAMGFCPTQMAILRYQPGDGYIGSSYLFPQAYQQSLAQLVTALERLPYDICNIRGIATDYLYMGLPEQAWAEFTRLSNAHEDIFTLHESVERRVLAGEFFAAPFPGVYAIEDFATVQDKQLQQIYRMNDAGGVNQAAIGLLPYLFEDRSAPLVDPLQSQFLALTYTINGEAGVRYVSAERCFTPEQNWSLTPVVSIAVNNPTDQPVTFFLQFGEGRRCGDDPFSGEVWRTLVSLGAHQSRVLTLRLDSPATFDRVSWSPQQNGQIDLSRVGYFAFGVETDAPAQGVLQISPIRRWP